ncbi:hypothetical protein [Companilactobacillus nodensis]|uniref:hypothetical protein n=1 Tax=Companilactobacillus nodensis TaxID=460870 RepID=UPI00046AF7CB|nr:hypothetical protein [Companilactobacillus nodensis]
MDLSKFDWIAIGSLIISLLSFIYTFTKTRKTINVTWDDNLIENPPDSTFIIDPNGKTPTFTHVLTGSISIVNPSSTDISYFDLRMFDPLSNLNVEIITKKTVQPYIKSKNIYQFLDNQYDRFQQMDVPERKFGILKSNSYTKIDVIGDFDVLPEKMSNVEKLTASFKIPKRAIFKDRYAITNRKKFKYYSKTYDITGWKARWQSMIKEQQQMILKAKKDVQNKQQEQ